jgi:hypothetical protein
MDRSSAATRLRHPYQANLGIGASHLHAFRCPAGPLVIASRRFVNAAQPLRARRRRVTRSLLHRIEDVTMRSLPSVAVIACAALAGPPTAEAQAPGSPTPPATTSMRAAPTTERAWYVPDAVTPFHSSQRELGDSQGMGAALRWSLVPRLALEAETEFRSGRFDTLKGLTANVVAEMPGVWRVTPFVVAGAGIDDYRWKANLPNHSFARTELNFAVNAGAGVQIRLTGAWSARADVRWSDGFAEQARPVMRVLYGVTLGLGEKP